MSYLSIPEIVGWIMVAIGLAAFLNHMQVGLMHDGGIDAFKPSSRNLSLTERTTRYVAIWDKQERDEKLFWLKLLGIPLVIGGHFLAFHARKSSFFRVPVLIDHRLLGDGVGIVLVLISLYQLKPTKGETILTSPIYPRAAKWLVSFSYPFCCGFSCLVGLRTFYYLKDSDRSLGICLAVLASLSCAACVARNLLIVRAQQPGNKIAQRV